MKSKLPSPRKCTGNNRIGQRAEEATAVEEEEEEEEEEDSGAVVEEEVQYRLCLSPFNSLFLRTGFCYAYL